MNLRTPPVGDKEIKMVEDQTSQNQGPPPEINYYFDPTFNEGKDGQAGPFPFTFAAVANRGTSPPDNAVRTPPPPREGAWGGDTGLWPCMANGNWELVENHVGESGYKNGEPFEIKVYGPPPSGWSKNPPPPTTAELNDRLTTKLQVELNTKDFKSTRALRRILALQAQLPGSSESAKSALEAEIAAESDILVQLEDESVELRAQIPKKTIN
jgi:hypothetical protein